MNWRWFLQFLIPMVHWVAAMNGCHCNAGHQGQQQTLCLLHDWFWWPGIATQMLKVISSCEQCIHHEGICAKVPVQPITFTAPLELLYVDFTSIEHKDGVVSTPKYGKYIGLLWPLYETHYDIHDLWSDCKNCYVSVARLHLDFQSPDQDPEWLGSQLLKQHYQRALWAYGHMEG